MKTINKRKMEELSFLVVWTEIEDGEMHDRFAHFNKIREAERRYNELLAHDSVYSASITIVYDSTDYGGLEDNDTINDLITANEVSQKLVG